MPVKNAKSGKVENTLFICDISLLILMTEYNDDNDRLTAFDPGQPG